MSHGDGKEVLRRGARQIAIVAFRPTAEFSAFQKCFSQSARGANQAAGKAIGPLAILIFRIPAARGK
jgi:hypothetical protein